MGAILLNAAHTAYSPGGVYKGVTEHGESLRLCRLLRESLLGLDKELQVKITEGNDTVVAPDDLLFVFHKGGNMKNERKRGAVICVKETASSEIQYRAYRLLCALCRRGLRFRGVHTLSEKNPFRFFINTPTENAYLVMAGFIESEEDTAHFGRYGSDLAYELSEEIFSIYKEKINEDNT